MRGDALFGKLTAVNRANIQLRDTSTGPGAGVSAWAASALEMYYMWDVEKENNLTALKRFIYSRESFGTPFVPVPAILFPEGRKLISTLCRRKICL